MTPIEIIAVLCGLISVILTIKQNIWCWPVGLVQVVLFIGIFYEAKLYSDMVLHVIYVFLQFYGWYHWLYGDKNRDRLPVTQLDLIPLAIWCGVVVIGTSLWGYAMFRWTDAAFPFADAFIMVASLIAQWLMAQKKLQSWWFWISVDVVAVYVYWYKELNLTAILYAIFLVLATLGWLAWRKTYLQPELNAA